MTALMKGVRRAALAVALTAAVMTGQAPGQPAPVQPEVTGGTAAPAGMPSTLGVRPNYVLGPNDQILVRVPEAEELNERPFRVDTDGTVNLPLVGVIRASGLTVEQFEAELTKALSKYIRSPHVAVTVAQYRSDPVFLTGAFARPGIYSLAGQRTLIELLTTAGGVVNNASRWIRITRRLEQGRIDLPNAIEDPDARTSTVDISLRRLMESTNAPENISLEPYDIVHAPRAEMVFVNFEGARAGAYPVDDRESLSVLQLLSIAGGLTPNLAPQKARVLRPVLDSSKRAEIPVDVQAILEGRGNDYPLMPNDVLFVPRQRSLWRPVARAMTFAVPSLVTAVIWVVVRGR